MPVARSWITWKHCISARKQECRRGYCTPAISLLSELRKCRRSPTNTRCCKELGVEVISVSVDSHFVHKMWNDYELSKMVQGGVPFHMASDQAGNVGRAYGVWDESQGIELRGRFIIDPDGVIQAMEVLTPPVGRRFAEGRGEQELRCLNGYE